MSGLVKLEDIDPGPDEDGPKPPDDPKPPLGETDVGRLEPEDEAPLRVEEVTKSSMAEPLLAALRQKVADLVARASASEVAARDAATAAARHAQAAAATADQARDQAAPNTAAHGFGEAARHAEGARYYATQANAAAVQAASQGTGATQAKADVDAVASTAMSENDPDKLERIVAAVADAVAVVEKFAVEAKAALDLAGHAAGEASTLGGFFVEAFKLWRALHL